MALLAFLLLRLLFPLLLVGALALALVLRVVPARRARRRERREWETRHVEAEFLPEEDGGARAVPAPSDDTTN